MVSTHVHQPHWDLSSSHLIPCPPFLVEAFLAGHQSSLELRKWQREQRQELRPRATFLWTVLTKLDGLYKERWNSVQLSKSFCKTSFWCSCEVCMIPTLQGAVLPGGKCQRLELGSVEWCQTLGHEAKCRNWWKGNFTWTQGRTSLRWNR